MSAPDRTEEDALSGDAALEGELLDDADVQIPRPSSPPTPKKDVPVTQTREVKGVDPAPPADGAELGGSTLAWLLSFRPFMTYFCWLAHRQHPAAHRPETRVSNHRSQNRALYWACVVADFLVILIAVALLIAATAVTLYKTILR